jgi:RNA polymerase sigma factor (sigma-70 family)
MAFDATIKEYLEEIDESPLLTAEEEHRLAKLVTEENDPIAREQLVRSNLRLVVNIAKKYASRGGMTLGDLIEEGNLGLIKAVDYFDPDRGTRFSTYAAWWIKQGIKSAQLTDVRPVHVPGYMIGLINHWRHVAGELENKLGRKPDVEEMAEVMNLPLKKAKIIDETVNVLVTVRDQQSDSSDENQAFEASIRNNGVNKPEDEMVDDEEKAKAVCFLNRIEPREAQILRLHYGLDGNKPMAFKEIAVKLDLTRERIRQIQHEALTKLYVMMSEEYDPNAPFATPRQEEDRRQRTEDRRRKAEEKQSGIPDASTLPKTCPGRQVSRESGTMGTEERRKRTQDRRKRTEDRRQKIEEE